MKKINTTAEGGLVQPVYMVSKLPLFLLMYPDRGEVSSSLSGKDI